MNTEKSDLLEFIRGETFNEEKAKCINSSMEEVFGVVRREELRKRHSDLVEIIEVGVLTWNVIDQIKRRHKEILVSRQPVFEWVKELISSSDALNKSDTFKRITYSISLGRLNYLKRHSDTKTMRDIIRLADDNSTLDVDPEKTCERVRDIVNNVSWFYQDSRMELRVFSNIMLEQLPLKYIDLVEDSLLREIALFVINIWVKFVPPTDGEVGDKLFSLAEKITNDFDEQCKITGIILDYYKSNNAYFQALTNKDEATQLLHNALDLLRAKEEEPTIM